MSRPGLRHLRPADYRRMPWKNGGGMTTEVAAEPNPQGAPDRPFLWRVSIADVEADGPFSAFAGYDRTILLLQGRGMRLEAGPHGIIALARPLAPQRFSGDWAVHGRLTDGPVRDFNLMVDRSRAEGSVEVLPGGGGPVELAPFPGETAVLHVVSGRIVLGTAEAATSDTLILDGGPAPEPFRLAAERGSALILARIRRLG